MLAIRDVALSKEEFQLLRDFVYRQTGIAMRDIKLPLLQSRLIRRVRQYGLGTFAEYYELLKTRDEDGRELQEMINAVTTNKTAFFRESHHFELFDKLVLGPARASAARGCMHSLRVWSAGCSSGEEPYSIAITAAERLPNVASWDLKILATDIDTAMLDRARTAIYGSAEASEVPSDILRKYFLRGTGVHDKCVRVKPEIASLVRFGRLNFADASWPIHARFDAIFCRNVIIYFDRECQRRTLHRMARLLKPGGILFAGHSENLFWMNDVFELVGNTAYRVRSKHD